MRLFAFLLFALTACAVEPVRFTVASAPDQIAAIIADAKVYAVLPTGSMEPAINEHDLLLVRSLPFAGVKVGDVILYRVDQTTQGIYTYSVICHRVWRKSSGGTVVLCRGDANGGYVDPTYVSEANYVGTVVAVVRKP